MKLFEWNAQDQAGAGVFISIMEEFQNVNKINLIS